MKAADSERSEREDRRVGLALLQQPAQQTEIRRR